MFLFNTELEGYAKSHESNERHIYGSSPLDSSIYLRRIKKAHMISYSTRLNCLLSRKHFSNVILIYSDSPVTAFRSFRYLSDFTA